MFNQQIINLPNFRNGFYSQIKDSIRSSITEQLQNLYRVPQIGYVDFIKQLADLSYRKETTPQKKYQVLSHQSSTPNVSPSTGNAPKSIPDLQKSKTLQVGTQSNSLVQDIDKDSSPLSQSKAKQKSAFKTHISYSKIIEYSTPINCVVYLSQSYIVLGFSSGNIQVNNIETLKQVEVQNQFQQHFKEVIQLCRIASSESSVMYFSSSALDNIVIVWRFDEKKQTLSVRQKLYGFTNPIALVMDVRDSQNIIAGDMKGEIYVWNYLEDKWRQKFTELHASKITAMTRSPAQGQFMVGSVDNVISYFRFGDDAKNFSIENTKKQQNQFGGILGIQAVPELHSSILIVGSQEGIISLFDSDKNIILQKCIFHKGGLSVSDPAALLQLAALAARHYFSSPLFQFASKVGQLPS